MTKVYAVYDTKAQVWNNVFFQPTDEAAVRSFELMFNEKSELHQYASDFELFCLGEYHPENSRKVNPLVAPEDEDPVFVHKVYPRDEEKKTILISQTPVGTDGSTPSVKTKRSKK